MRKIVLILEVFLLIQVVIPLVVLDIQADDWPTFQHDNRRLGYSTCEVPDVAHLNWSMDFEKELKSPVVAEDKVFVICNRTLYAIDIFTREIRWSFNDANSIAGIMGGKIFVGGSKIYGINIDTGNIIWQSDCGCGADVTYKNLVITSVIWPKSGDLVLYIYALNQLNGSVIWDCNISFSDVGNRNIAIADDIVFISIPTSNYVYGSGTVIALNANNGSQIWRMNFPAWVACMPTIHNGVVYVSTYENKLYALDEDGNGDGTTDVLWTFDILSYTRSSVAIAYDMIFVGSAKGYFWALDVDPGDGMDEGIVDPDGSEYDVIWRSSAGLVEDGSPVIGDGKVVVYADSGYLYVLNASNGEKIWGKSLPDQQDSTPAIAYDRLFVSAGNTLYVYSLNQKPIANLTCNKLIGNVTTSFEFNATGSYDPDGYLVNRVWDFGDGITDYGENVSHVFKDDGVYVVNLTVIDNDFVRSDKSSVTITVQNLPPIANFSANRTKIMAGEGVAFNASASSDPDDTDLNYTWDFGDGCIGYGERCVHNYSRKGTYIVELTVTDDDEETDSYKITIDVSKPARDNNYIDFFSNAWNIIGLSVLLLVIVIIIVYLLSKFKRL